MNIPGGSYYDKELVVFPFAMYTDCLNDEWSATVNYTGMNGIEYTVTAVDADTLLMQHAWTVDGAPAVGYEWRIVTMKADISSIFTTPRTSVCSAVTKSNENLRKTHETR